MFRCRDVLMYSQCHTFFIGIGSWIQSITVITKTLFLSFAQHDSILKHCSLFCYKNNTYNSKAGWQWNLIKSTLIVTKFSLTVQVHACRFFQGNEIVQTSQSHTPCRDKLLGSSEQGDKKYGDCCYLLLLHIHNWEGSWPSCMTFHRNHHLPKFCCLLQGLCVYAQIHRNREDTGTGLKQGWLVLHLVF